MHRNLENETKFTRDQRKNDGSSFQNCSELVGVVIH